MTSRLLVFSHAGVLEVNRAVFQSLAEQFAVEVMLVAPETWTGDLLKNLRFEEPRSGHAIGTKSLRTAFSGNGSLFFYPSGIQATIDQFKPTHIFVDEEPWSLNAFQVFRAAGRIPVSFFTKQNLLKRLPPPFSWIQNYVLKKAAHAYSVAPGVTEILKKKGFKKTIFELPHSYDPDLFRRLGAHEKSEIRRRLGIPENALVFGYFGRISQEKGIRDLVEGIESLLPEFPNLFFLCVGNGPLFEWTRAEVLSLPKGQSLLFPAIPHHEVGRTLASIDLLVLPSRTTRNWKEQFGRILVEAMGCGAAVVGSDSGEIPSLIKRSGGGAVFKEGNVSDLVATIGGLARDPEHLEKLQSHGHAFVTQELTHRAVAKKLAETLGLS